MQWSNKGVRPASTTHAPRAPAFGRGRASVGTSDCRPFSGCVYVAWAGGGRAGGEWVCPPPHSERVCRGPILNEVSASRMLSKRGIRYQHTKRGISIPNAKRGISIPSVISARCPVRTNNHDGPAGRRYMYLTTTRHIFLTTFDHDGPAGRRYLADLALDAADLPAAGGTCI